MKIDARTITTLNEIINEKFNKPEGDYDTEKKRYAMSQPYWERVDDDGISVSFLIDKYGTINLYFRKGVTFENFNFSEDVSLKLLYNSTTINEFNKVISLLKEAFEDTPKRIEEDKRKRKKKLEELERIRKEQKRILEQEAREQEIKARANKEDIVTLLSSIFESVESTDEINEDEQARGLKEEAKEVLIKIIDLTPEQVSEVVSKNIDKQKIEDTLNEAKEGLMKLFKG